MVPDAASDVVSGAEEGFLVNDDDDDDDDDMLKLCAK